MTIELTPIARCNGRDCHVRQPLTALPHEMDAQLFSLGWRVVPSVPPSRSGPIVAAQHFCPACR